MVLRLGQGDINFVDDKLPFHFPLMRRTASDLTEPYQATVPERLLMDSEQNSAERADRKLLVSRSLLLRGTLEGEKWAAFTPASIQ